jgi:molecular chaperone GrpE (heat shock protein)
MCFLWVREEEQVAKKVPNASKPRPSAPRRGTVAKPRKAGAAVTAPAPTATPPAVESLDGAVDSLRRLLSELLEQRLESIARGLADVRRTLASGGDLATGLDQLDEVLDSMGAIRFSAEPFDVMDPLIHTVVAERPGNGVPRGVVLEAVRPGFRSSRGLVLAKAAVAVSVG